MTEVVVPAGAARFVPLPPTRVLDSRPGPRQVGYAGLKPAARSTVTLQVAGRGGVPADDATAVVLNLTATGAAARGYVTAYQADQARPATPNLRVGFAGETISNLVVVPLSEAGQIDLFTSLSAHLLADVEGYFTGALSAPAGRLVAVTPTRLLDTRRGSRRVGYSGGKPAAGTTVTVLVTGRGGLPADGVSAAVLNVTATNAPRGSAITVWPADRGRPTASNVTLSRSSQTIANAVWVRVPANGRVKLHVSRPTDLMVDVDGWFTAQAAPYGTAGLFVPVQPTRLFDTRPGVGQAGYTGPKPSAGTTVAVRIAGRGPVPATTAGAVVANVTASQVEGPGYVTAYPAGVARPLASNLNPDRAGYARSNLVTSRLGGGVLNLYTSFRAHLIVDVAGYFTSDLNPPAPATQHASYRAAAGTTVVEPAAVTAVVGAASTGYTVTLAAGSPRPSLGGGMVVKGGGAVYPDGLAGTVSEISDRSDGTATVIVAPAPLDQLFDSLDVGYDGPLDLVPTPAPSSTKPGRAQRAGLSRSAADVGGSISVDHSIIDFGAGAFTCDVQDGVTVSAAAVRFENSRVHFEKRVGLTSPPFVQFYLQTEPVVDFTGDVHGKVSCKLSDAFRASHRLVWWLPTEIPVTVDLAPALQFEATIAGKATFTVHFYRMVGLVTNPDLSVQLYNAASQTTEQAEVVGELSASLLLGADVSVKVLDVAGIGVTLGPQFVAAVDARACVTLTVAIHAEFDLRLNLWIRQFTHTVVGIDVGLWELHKHCSDSGGSGGGGNSGGGTGPLGTILADLGTHAFGISFSPHGKLFVYQKHTTPGICQLRVHDADSQADYTLTTSACVQLDPRWAASGSTLLFSVPVSEAEDQLFVWDAASHQTVRIAADARVGADSAAISADGRFVSFSGTVKADQSPLPGATTVIYARDAERSVALRGAERVLGELSWSPVGHRFIATWISTPSEAWELCAGQGISCATPVLSGGPDTFRPTYRFHNSWSPDGRLVTIRRANEALHIYDMINAELLTPPLPADAHLISVGWTTHPGLRQAILFLGATSGYKTQAWSPENGALTTLSSSTRSRTQLLSPDGSLLLEEDATHPGTWVVVDTSSGRTTRTTIPADGAPFWSSDNRHVVGGDRGLWTWNARSNTVTQLRSESSDDCYYPSPGSASGRFALVLSYPRCALIPDYAVYQLVDLTGPTLSAATPGRAGIYDSPNATSPWSFEGDIAAVYDNGSNSVQNTHLLVVAPQSNPMETT
jgi:hypothetical protein